MPTGERLVAVVCAYWPQRRDNVVRIVRDLLAGSRVPDRIVVLDNLGSSPEAWVDRGLPLAHPTVQLLPAGWNTWTRGKYVAGLLDPARWYLLVDDDVSPQPGAVEHHLTAASGLADPDFACGFWGARLSPAGRFGDGQIVVPESLTEPELVDAFHGRFVLATFGAVTRMLAAEEHVRVADGHRRMWDHEGCDILAGLANPGRAWTIPSRHADHTGWDELPSGGVALQDTAGYFTVRDEFTVELVRRLGTHPG